jgi:hypothetical protein
MPPFRNVQANGMPVLCYNTIGFSASERRNSQGAEAAIISLE